MEEIKNESYDRIIQYIKENKNYINEEDLKFLLRYARSLKIRNYQNKQDLSIKEVLDDMSALNETMRQGELTHLTIDRLKREMELIEALISGEDIDVISYELDRLYVENDMGARKNSSLSYKLNIMEKRNKKSNERSQ